MRYFLSSFVGLVVGAIIGAVLGVVADHFIFYYLHLGLMLFALGGAVVLGVLGLTIALAIAFFTRPKVRAPSKLEALRWIEP